MSEYGALPEIALGGRTMAIADLHLDPFDESACESFAAWTRGLTCGLTYDRLLVLGDLFDAWVGPAHQSAPGARLVIGALRALRAAGKHVLVLQGNRDFLLGTSFARATEARLLPDGFVGLLEDGGRVLFLHGDELCTRDRAYQRLRRVTHSRIVQTLGPHVPFFVARPIARRLRRASQRALAYKPREDKEIQLEAAEAEARVRECSTLVCGHVHEARDVRSAAGLRWLILDAFGGPLDALRIDAAGVELTSSGLRAGKSGAV